MTTKLVIFDLDGVLIDSKDYHYEALNQALSLNSNPTQAEDFTINREEHVLFTMDFLLGQN